MGLVNLTMVITDKPIQKKPDWVKHQPILFNMKAHTCPGILEFDYELQDALDYGSDLWLLTAVRLALFCWLECVQLLDS